MIHQSIITRESIVGMLYSPRRFRLRDFDQPLKAPGTLGSWQEDWNLRFPFKETFVPAFEEMCKSIDHRRPFLTTGVAHYTFLKNVTDNDIEKVRQWLELLQPYVAIRDCLALSFAIDYDSEDGNPGRPFTTVGNLRKQAKTYGKTPTHASLAAADELIKLCLHALRELTCYDSATCVVAVPPSDPAKPYNLPQHIAAGIAAGLGKKDLCAHVKTNRARQSVRGTPCAEKLPVIEGTVSVTPGVFEGQTVLLVDDLYQSGVTMNYVAMLLLESGAKKVFGLACEKTCSNDDNVSRR